MNNKVTAESIFKEYLKLQKIRPGFRRFEASINFQSFVVRNQDALYELIFSGLVKDESQLHDLIFYGGHRGSVSKDLNFGWLPFLKLVNERVSELPESIQYTFKWLGESHNYWS